MSEAIVATRYGRVRGVHEDELVVFRGIPFAAPPVGELRFAAPRRPEAWEGVRGASSFAPMAPQQAASPLEAIPGDPIEQSEDCLALNVWTPGLDGPRRPVMVFVHGGGFIGGSSSVSVYRGTALARAGAVVVTFNYRLGALGWLAHPALAAGSGAGVGFGNWGLLDQLAALTYVRENIELFGGDPSNVTVFGESAGAMSVAALLATREGRPLLRRAILQSGAAAAIGVAEASLVAERMAAELGLSGVDLGYLRAAPADELLAAQQAVVAAQGTNGLAFQPVVDGGILNQHPATAIAGGAAAGIDVIAGTNRDEWAFFTFGAAAESGISEERLLRLVGAQISAAGRTDIVPAEEFIDTHRKERAARGEATDPASLYTAMATDWVFRVPAMRLLSAQAAHGAGTYAYLFDWETPFGGGRLGSCHALELPFVFGTFDHPFISLFSGSGSEVAALSEAVRTAWVAFARTGDPSTGGEAPQWPAYTVARRETMRLGACIELLQAPLEVERAWLDARFGPYGVMEERGLAHVRQPVRGT
jgi:para-nitrobenzyl esterase